MISKKFTFLNVGNQATFLGNIKNSIDAANIGTDYGWVIDRYDSGDDGLIMAHSFGAHGNQNLFYSLKLRNPNSGTAHIHLCGQTGYDSGLGYDAQPGRFTIERSLVGAWNGVSTNKYMANYLKTPTTKQVIFVNKQNIHVFWEGEISLFGVGTVYPVWYRFTLGAMDSFFPEAETVLNYVDETIWSDCGWASCNFMGGWGYYPYYHSGENASYAMVRPITGLLYKQPFDAVPVNKDFHNNEGTYTLRASPRWYSTLHYRDSYNYYRYSATPPTYYYSSWDYTSWRLGANYTRGSNYNTSFVKHFMHKPVVILYEQLDAENIFHYPIGYLPYQALYMGGLLKGDDTVSFGTRNFGVYPTFRNGNAYGMAIEFIEG